MKSLFFTSTILILFTSCQRTVYKEVNTGEVLRGMNLNCEFGQLYNKIDRGAIPIYNNKNTVFRCVEIKEDY